MATGTFVTVNGHHSRVVAVVAYHNCAGYCIQNRERNRLSEYSNPTTEDGTFRRNTLGYRG